MQVTGVDPTTTRACPPIKDNVFAVGDCTFSSLQEDKTIGSLKFLAGYCINNIIDIASGRRPSHPLPNSIPFMSFMSLGPQYGI